jgi:hypothetical protein
VPLPPPLLEVQVPDDVETSAQSVVVCEALPDVPVTEML